MMNTQLLHSLPAEQARCRELVRQYVAIGSAGAFASALIEHSLRLADRDRVIVARCLVFV